MPSRLPRTTREVRSQLRAALVIGAPFAAKIRVPRLFQYQPTRYTFAQRKASFGTS
jgi:hypothetical protein